MIAPRYCRTMAQYNQWQNNGLRDIVKSMDEDALRLDRGAFFGSIWNTLNHLLWADQLWMARFDGGDGPSVDAARHTDVTTDPAQWDQLRAATDARILDWAASVETDDLEGDLTWYSGMSQRDLTKPKALCITHFFNHQTHHRGQLHAMLTASGQSPIDTDLALMSES